VHVVNLPYVSPRGFLVIRRAEHGDEHELIEVEVVTTSEGAGESGHGFSQSSFFLSRIFTKTNAKLHTFGLKLGPSLIKLGLGHHTIMLSDSEKG